MFFIEKYHNSEYRTSIEDSIFSCCSGLETVIIGENVKTFCDKVFSECNSLKSIYFYGETSLTVEISAFYNVPATSVKTYQSETFVNFSVSK